MKKFFSTLFVVLFATSMMAQMGLTCEDPIYVGDDYEGRVEGECELWFTATTYDLPLHVYFIPDADDSFWGPEVSIDFTCKRGVYDDPKLDSLVNMVSDFNIKFPIEMLSEEDKLGQKTVWSIDVQKSNREQLADFGITYPLQAFVKVTFYEAGTITMTPDTVFSSCMENAHYVTLGDTLDISANDTERTFVFPYTEWQEDSIRFVWTGAEPAQVYVAVQECSFAPGSSYVFDNFVVAQDAPHKLYSEDMKAAITANKEGGLYYAKVVAPGAGQLVVEKIPMSAVEGDAQVLEHGTEIVLEDILYCFPKTWTATQIVAATSKPLSVYVSNVAEFTASANDANVLAVYDAHLEGANRAVYLSGKELSTLANDAKGDYLYVRFSSVATKVAIDQWNASECADESYLLRPNKAQFIEAKSSIVVYRVRYADFSGYPLTIKWDSSNKLPIFISDICNYDLTTNNPALLVNPRPSITAGRDYVIDAATVDSWASRIGEDGYFYVRCNPNNPGELTFTSDKPADETPVVPEPEYVYESAAVCFGETYEWKGQTLAESGKYTHEETDENGAVTITELTFTVYPQTKGTAEVVEIPFGATYDWNGVTYAESGEYIITLQDEHGCNYQDTLVLTILPEEKPEFEYPVVEESSEEPLLINYSLATQIYGMDQPAWVANDVTLHWSGASPLHIFISKKPDFALAKGHKNVVKYIEVPANGSVVLSKSEVEALSQYKNEGGYLYVRCLSEFEGELTTKQAE
jgi:hypothetical protein